MVERMDIEAAMATLGNDTITSDQVKELFASLADKTKASSARVARMPSSQRSFAELEACKQRLKAKLEHLSSTGDVLGSMKAADVKD